MQDLSSLPYPLQKLNFKIKDTLSIFLPMIDVLMSLCVWKGQKPTIFVMYLENTLLIHDIGSTYQSHSY